MKQQGLLSITGSASLPVPIGAAAHLPTVIQLARYGILPTQIDIGGYGQSPSLMFWIVGSKLAQMKEISETILPYITYKIIGYSKGFDKNNNLIDIVLIRAESDDRARNAVDVFASILDAAMKVDTIEIAFVPTSSVAPWTSSPGSSIWPPEPWPPVSSPEPWRIPSSGSSIRPSSSTEPWRIPSSPSRFPTPAPRTPSISPNHDGRLPAMAH